MPLSSCLRQALRVPRRVLAPCIALLLAVLATVPASAVTLADQPVFASSDVPGNLALALSVEYPTAISVANLGDYADASEYLGYFDPRKCYTYQANTAAPAQGYFQPAGTATGSNGHSCSGQWSGNFMNWATMQTIDPFRWALTGGYRSVDTADTTVLEKAWGSAQGSQSNFPLRGTSAGSGHRLASGLVASVTPFSWSAFNMSVWKRGNRLVFSGTNSAYSDTSKNGNDWVGTTSQNDPGTVYQVYVRVKVCDASSGTGGVEANCVKYGGNYKPEGLMQQYANKIRYSAFSYLYTSDGNTQGGVMRAAMGFIGPTYPQPLSTTVVTNPKAEWDPTTGVMTANPDSTLDSTVTNSGAMNYLNKFGQSAQAYMTYDNVSELYYAVLRYFENLGNVPEWTSNLNATKRDGFPAPTSWDGKDPISYSCQKNFVLGIGDDNTHFDVNTGGGTLTKSGRTKPPLVASDSFNQSQTWTRAIETLEGLTSRNAAWADAGSEYIAGLAYGAHVLDIRPDLTGTQTLSTYWMDVMEYQYALDRNPYWLATKYGGFSVPSGYDIATTTPLAQSAWNSSGDTINMNGTTRPRPDNYFLAGNAALMVAGLKAAFTNIANAIKAFTTSYSLASAAVQSGDAAYASQYDSKGWTGVVTARQVTYATDGTPSSTDVWNTTTTLESQLAGTGWNTGRQVVTWNGTAGVPFRTANSGTATGMTSAQIGALNTSYRSGDDSSDYLNYLRGDRSQETSSTAAGSSKAYRARSLLLADIVDSKVVPVGPPSAPYAESSNLGYSVFKANNTGRTTMVYVGANDGMLHAFDGSLTGSTAGKEKFAYVPGGMYLKAGATDTDSLLGQLGNPNYVHHYYVDATPTVADVDFNKSAGAFTTSGTGANADWRTLLVGGLGKGGTGWFGIDVTSPAAMSSETATAAKVLWEVNDPTMGYSFGSPIIVKTRKYGWVVVLTSGYNNADGYGYLYFVDPRNGTILEKVRTGTASHGLAQASAFVQDFGDYTADAIYAGDLDGNVWRFDLTAATGSYPAPTRIATLTDGSGNAQPVTTAPLIEIHPVSRARFVMVGTGKLLDSSDVNTSAGQSFYALLDGTSGGFGTVSTPITRAQLTALTDPTAGVNLATTSKGWYMDLGSGSGVAWRIIGSPSAYNGIVAFSPLLTTGDACSPAGQSRLYVLNYGTGKTVLNTAAAYENFTAALTDVRFVTVNGKPQLIVGDNQGGTKKIDANLVSGTSLRLLNWRQIPIPE